MKHAEIIFMHMYDVNKAHWQLVEEGKFMCARQVRRNYLVLSIVSMDLGGHCKKYSWCQFYLNSVVYENITISGFYASILHRSPCIHYNKVTKIGPVQRTNMQKQNKSNIYSPFISYEITVTSYQRFPGFSKILLQTIH